MIKVPPLYFPPYKNSYCLLFQPYVNFNSWLNVCGWWGCILWWCWCLWKKKILKRLKRKKKRKIIKKKKKKKEKRKQKTKNSLFYFILFVGTRINVSLPRMNVMQWEDPFFIFLNNYQEWLVADSLENIHN